MPAKRFLLRPAVAADCEAIAEAHVDSIRSLGAKTYDPEIIDVWGAPRSGEAYRRAMDDKQLFFVAVEADPGGEGRILGFSSYRFEDGKHRTAVYVRGESAKRGIGTALLSSAESAARDHGATKIDVDASLTAVAFYKANGFKDLGVGEHHLEGGGRMNCVFMRKCL